MSATLDTRSVISLDPNGDKTAVFDHPAGTFALTPASHTLISSILEHSDLLYGTGIDWGSGVGCAAIVAAKAAPAQELIGLEIDKENLAAAIVNAEQNGVTDKIRFILADSYSPFEEDDRAVLSRLKGKTDFIVSNPPSSEGDDGFSFRREVLRGAKAYLKKGGVVFLNISFQYGQQRIDRLLEEIGGFAHRGVLYSTKPVPFDLTRSDLYLCLIRYSKEEENGGPAYTFLPAAGESGYLDAREAFARYRKTGASPLTRWQTHLFEFLG